MKCNIYVEHEDKSITDKDLMTRAKEIWKEKGFLIKDLKYVDLYYKPSENKCYFVANKDACYDFTI